MLIDSNEVKKTLTSPSFSPLAYGFGFECINYIGNPICRYLYLSFFSKLLSLAPNSITLNQIDKSNFLITVQCLNKFLSYNLFTQS